MGRFLNFLKGQSEKDNPKVIHDKESTPNSHYFTIHHPNLGKKGMHLHVYFPHPNPEHEYSSDPSEYKHGRIDVATDKKRKLSHAHQRHILGRIKHHIPHLETLSGHRVTGSRKETEKEGSVNVSKVKPISEEILRQFHLIESIA